MRLTVDEIQIVLTSLAKTHTKHGFGYSDDSFVAGLQTKLSLMLAVAAKMENK